ncbi:MAG: HD domain-containing protein [Ktedonobacterales bacterium]
MTTGRAGDDDAAAAKGAPAERGSASGGLGAVRPRTLADPLYGSVRIAGWTAALLATPPFRRLAGVSLSDVPGELLFGAPFPSRLDHAIGVYHLARIARPRDRALQAAALAHDLGHGPLSHLTEPLMRERLALDHEQRSAHLLAEVAAALPAETRARLAWLDWDEVAGLVLGKDRGELLNGRLDYDNADNVARFLAGAEMGAPAYDAETLAPALKLARAADAHGERVFLQPEAEPQARAWQQDRARMYHYLHEGHRNLALHAMLRKAVDLGAATGILPTSFFDMTDRQALRLLGDALDRGLAALVRQVRASAEYACVWEAVVPDDGTPLAGHFASWRERLALEAMLAAEAALAPHEVVVDLLTSGAVRALPPLGSPSGPLTLPPPDAGESPAPRVLRLFAPATAARDYLRRLRLAATRHFAPLGAVPHSSAPE